MSDAILDQLNPEQRKAAKTIDGPVLVLAGAGTGKTRVITFRIAYMLQRGIDPRNILGLTFTNKAAREMRERLAQLVDPTVASKVTLGTFHAFCVKVLRKEIGVLNFTSNFTIADSADQQGLLKQALAELGYNKDVMPLDVVAGFISKKKNVLIDPVMASNTADNEFESREALVYRKYQELLENQNMIDFDDMMMFVCRIFDKNPEVLEKYRNIYKYVMVDEYQDTNDAQFELLRMLVDKHQNICVVGDDDQSIYGWRGANISNILDFPRKFKNTTEIKLEQNYRSTNKILTAANVVIAGNADRYEKNLWSAQGDGDNIKLVETGNAEAEGLFIADYIRELKSSNPRLEYRDFAILYRSNHLSRVLERSLRQAQLPYRLVGGQEFFNRKEVKDAVAYLKLIVNPKEDQSFLRIIGTPPRGLGGKALERLKELQQVAFLPYSELLEHEAFLESVGSKAASAAREFHQCVTEYRKLFAEPGTLALNVKNYLLDIGYLHGLQRTYKDIKDAEKRLENVNEFINAVAEFEKKCDRPVSLVEYLESYALLEENDRTKEEDDDNCITLCTVHASKGLEFPVVFLVAMERNVFPNERAEMERSLDEELRLFYVAITRAKNELVMTYSRERMYRGVEKRQVPSRFLHALPEELVDKCGVSDLIQTLDNDEMMAGFANIFAMLQND